MSEVKRDRQVAGFDAGLFDASKLLGGVFVRKTKALRNTIGKGYRAFDVGVTTLCYISDERAFYELISNPDTEVTSDTDWQRVLTVTSGLQPLGVWNIDNVDPELQDADAEEFNANFYFVTGAASPTLINIPGLFNSASVTVKDGDLIVSNGTVWFVNPLNISWDTLDKPQVIIDYVDGTVISHTHEIDDVNGLQDALDAKYDEGDVTPLDEDFGTIPDIMLTNLGFLKLYYYTKDQVYTKDEIDDLFTDLEDFYTKAEIDALFVQASDDLQEWVAQNYYDQETVDQKIAEALDGVDGVIIGEVTLVQRDALSGGDTVNGYVLAVGHRLIVDDTGGRYVDKFIGLAGESGASFWIRLYLYDIHSTTGRPVLYMGIWDATSGDLGSVPAGSGPSGSIEEGNLYDVELDDPETPVVIGGVTLYHGSTARAKQDNPTLISHYKIQS